MDREDKLKMTCSPEQLAEILRSMAEAMEQGRLSLENTDMTWNEVEKISLTVRNAAGMADVKIRITSSEYGLQPESMEEIGESAVSGEDADVDQDQDQVAFRAPSSGASGISGPPSSRSGKPRESYGSLKKRMKKSFKNIMYSLHENIWPPMADIEEFVRDSAQMVRYPGKGDEFYAVYSEAVSTFVDAVHQQDLEAAFEAAHLLNTLKTRCHKKYD